MKKQPQLFYTADMNETLELKPVAHIENAFDSKFGIPRQARLIDEVSRVVLEKEYQKDGIFRELEQFSHLWLIFGFTGFYHQKWSPTVRPPRLGGNERVGVFASRSPHRPNPIGLSAVKIIKVESYVILVEGADLMNGTPIYDIKPYIPYADLIPEAAEGYAAKPSKEKLKVIIPKDLCSSFDDAFLHQLQEILQLDPRPAYIEDPDRIYGFSYGGHEIRFKVKENLLTVLSIA